MDITEEHVDTKNVNSINLNVQDPKCIHPNSDINSRSPTASKKELKEMYPECFSDKGSFKDYKYHIE